MNKTELESLETKIKELKSYVSLSFAVAIMLLIIVAWEPELPTWAKGAMVFFSGFIVGNVVELNSHIKLVLEILKVFKTEEKES